MRFRPRPPGGGQLLLCGHQRNIDALITLNTRMVGNVNVLEK